MDVAPVLDLVAAASPARGFTFVGIGGHGGAGKSTLASRIPGAQVVGTDEFWDGDGFELASAQRGVRPARRRREARFESWDWCTAAPAGPGHSPEGIVVVEGVCAPPPHVPRRLRRPRLGRRAVRRAARAGDRAGRRGRAGDVGRALDPDGGALRRADDPVSCAHVVVDGGALEGERGGRCDRSRPGTSDTEPRMRPTPTSGRSPRCVSPPPPSSPELFFALGGSAVAVTEAVRPQARCQAGAVRGFVAVNGDPAKGIANLGDQFTSARPGIGVRFNCAGAAPQARRVNVGVYEVRFPGNATQIAAASSPAAETTVGYVGGASSGSTSGYRAARTRSIRRSPSWPCRRRSAPHLVRLGGRRLRAPCSAPGRLLPRLHAHARSPGCRAASS